MSRRSERVADLLRQEISEILRIELRDPRVGMATVTDVDASPDLRHAVVRVSLLGDDDERAGSLAALRRASGFVRGRLARRARQLRFIPELEFELDRGAEHSDRIERLLESLHDEDRRT
ncbi:MAG: 30S ribosome-binding factor RbfA [Acidobacteriota bacterium]|nr:30S ribosome-binding factor RbfA [Acidobacteriota bacterium]